MSDAANSFTSFLSSLPTELKTTLIVCITICFCCCIKDYVVCCWRERRANRRLQRLESIALECREQEAIDRLQRSIQKFGRPTTLKQTSSTTKSAKRPH